MNGAQDAGGMTSFGPVNPERDEPIFHAEWEKRALALVLACGALGAWNLDANRHMRESLRPDIYWSISYYHIWIRALSAMLVKHGFISAAELAGGEADLAAAPRAGRAANKETMLQVIARGAPYNRPAASPAVFALGDQVRARNVHPAGHTRLPRYVRGRTGVVEALCGCFVFPDSNAHGKGEAPQHCYTVRFEGRELWGPDADPALAVSVDAFEAYLERA